jgi:hypothetical protein
MPSRWASKLETCPAVGQTEYTGGSVACDGTSFNIQINSIPLKIK